MTSSTRPEINSASHCRQRRIKPLVTRTENLVKLDVWALDTRVDRQTNRQTDRHADQNTAHTYRGWSNDAKYNEQSKNFDKRPHRRLVTSHGGEWIRPSNTWFFGPHKSDLQTASWSVQQLCVHCSSGADNPQNCPLPLGDRNPVVLWAHSTQPPNGISIGLAVSASLMNATKRPTTLLRV